MRDKPDSEFKLLGLRIDFRFGSNKHQLLTLLYRGSVFIANLLDQIFMLCGKSQNVSSNQICHFTTF